MRSKENVQIKLWEAIEELAQGPGEIRERIANAQLQLSSVYVPEGEDLSATDREEMISIRDEITKGSLHMSDQEAESLVKRILALYAKLCSED